jgi:hypothetical protein
MAGLLEETLAAAVPLEIMQIAGMDQGQREYLRARLRMRMQEGADQMLYGGPLCAPTFTVFAQALALLSFTPGGVTFGPLRWCAAHLGRPWPETGGVPCPHCLAAERGCSPSGEAAALKAAPVPVRPRPAPRDGE